jgi:nickel/cobalt exporter
MADNDKAKLKTLLNYWIEHNREHGEEFREWAEKAGTFGAAEAGAQLLKAAEEMDKATVFLTQAQGGLED